MIGLHNYAFNENTSLTPGQHSFGPGNSSSTSWQDLRCDQIKKKFNGIDVSNEKLKISFPLALKPGGTVAYGSYRKQL